MTTATDEPEATLPQRTLDLPPQAYPAIAEALSEENLRAALAEGDILLRARMIAEALVPGEECVDYWRQRRNHLILTFLARDEMKVSIMKRLGVQRTTVARLKNRMPEKFEPAKDPDVEAEHARRVKETVAPRLPDWRDARDDTIHRLTGLSGLHVTNEEIGDLFGITKVRVTQIRGGSR